MAKWVVVLRPDKEKILAYLVSERGGHHWSTRYSDSVLHLSKRQANKASHVCGGDVVRADSPEFARHLMRRASE